MSIRREKNKRPLMLVGHEESTYHQLIFSKKHWKGPSSRNFILPKGVGEILMLSGFVCREVGLGFGGLLTPEIITQINDHRRGTIYIYLSDAILIRTYDMKGDIVDDLLLK